MAESGTVHDIFVSYRRADRELVASVVRRLEQRGVTVWYDANIEGELRTIFGRLPDEPLPDLSAVPPEVFTYAAPLGTYFDVYPLHLLTTAALAEVSRLNPNARADRRRFRPNLLIESERGTTGVVENGWLGRTVRIGSVEILSPRERQRMSRARWQSGSEPGPGGSPLPRHPRRRDAARFFRRVRPRRASSRPRPGGRSGQHRAG